MDPFLRFGPEICRDLTEATSREWLETNGIGSFASGTISGINTRRYHGVLTAATKPPLGRITAVAKVEETLIVDGRSFDLSANRYPGKVHPEGFRLISGFRLDPFPIWTYEIEGIVIEKSLFMPHGRNAVVVSYRCEAASGEPVLNVRPLVSFADYHHLRRETEAFDRSFASDPGVVRMRPDHALPELCFSHNAAQTTATGHWYRGFELAIEEERGFDFREDLFQPFELSFDLARPVDVVISVGEPLDVRDADELRQREIARRSELEVSSGLDDSFSRQLALAADQFIVKRGRGSTVIAGYPWFSDWGRDTMIALPGLTIATRRYDVAHEILLEFAEHISEGMIPNRFPDEGENADYNTVDATLWYFEAIRAYHEATADHELVRERLFPVLSDIVEWHLSGTRFGIRVDTDGLLAAGTPAEQLTWMDAKIGDLVITPRSGKAVEIQALWYNALRIMQKFAESFSTADADRYASMADLAKLSFAAFWNDEQKCLYDVVDNGTRDAAVRPNQIFAVSLHHSLLNGERARMVVDRVAAELLTPYGLRSLSPNDPAYVGTYIGTPLERDSAYHQGTVWGWLIGPFIDAFRKVYPERESEIADLLGGSRSHIAEAGLGQISEIFDGDAPHAPRGCPAQAWSVGELLRVIQTKKAAPQ